MDLFSPRFFEDSYASRRHAYARAAMLKKACESPAVIDALIKHLAVPHGAQPLSKVAVSEKQEALRQHVDHVIRMRTSRWYGLTPEEVVAAAVVEARLPASERDVVLPKVRKEADLTTPVVNWVRQYTKVVAEEVPMGTKRADVVGYRPEGLLTTLRIVAIELKNDLTQLNRGLDQMTSYCDYSTQVYLGCTPRLAAEYLKHHANSRGVRRWEPDALQRKLEKFGFGLLLIEGDAVYEVHTPRSSSVASKFRRQVESHMPTV